MKELKIFKMKIVQEKKFIERKTDLKKTKRQKQK